jgi:aspartyl-tRNA(Asn)/glutamyl-tRNA(Gln) amidotransferase subunit A
VDTPPFAPPDRRWAASGGSIAELASAVASGAVSPVDIAEEFLVRVALREPDVRAFAHLDARSVRRQAEQAAAEVRSGHRRGPLHGLPIGVKDLIDTADLPTGYGSPAWSGYRPARDAAVVSRLRDAGAVVFGKTTTAEFAVGIACEPTTNPWRSDRVPGGSSGGSAAAVAAGECVAAIGTDTGGSIRIPAAFCGCYGLRPSAGRIPLAGVWPAAPTLDRVGPIAATAADAEVLYRCLAGLDPARQPEPAPLTGARIGVLVDWLDAADPGVADVVRAAVRRLAGLAELVEVPVPAAHLAGPAYRGLAIGELAEVHLARSSPETRQRNPALAQAVAFGAQLDAPTRAAARSAAAELARAWDALFAERRLDFLVSPTVPFPACRPGELPTVEMRVGEFTIPISLAGLPSASQPVGQLDGLPVGLHWVGRRDDDLRLLAAGRQFENLSAAPERGAPHRSGGRTT